MEHNIDVKFYPGWTRKAMSFSIDDGNLEMDKKFMDIVEPYGFTSTPKVKQGKLIQFPLNCVGNDLSSRLVSKQVFSAR